ncbi:uncharacterized protein CLUP02_02369 [Colletotrichum lupini]|uniref:Isopropanol dehydrogenase n=3 Tax=Colletotrichum acutatum species complex TaxID=2707335 RepID=A0A9Q8SGY6_9PEZI|nr:uncharacterized protein CLUP02_02369 [Colletotrichum lupini]XP_060305044.1 uncharacterized protein CCOS01_16143 [Colletotrichum costaricense]XP_060389362.1 uncharacterized protein CTAM01_12806 [Colletotrichum tamarilloi]KAK1507837.1 hypothetical protein CCOS01_16143 [Colletotrichum costaricense]KAK1732041.1 hypothetical protein CTAM01_12806 [Colletotrichum tamarilloi]UQC76903.1 hypothetical protein CLUP02_02369 [Colletotrichum lupini]
MQIRSIPEATPGSVVIRVLAATVRANSPRIYRDPQSGYPLPFPLVPGHTAIGRVFKISSDVTILKEGQLVFFDPYIQARDGGGFYVSAMMEGLTPESFKLSRGDWRDGTYADYAKLPIENCHVLDDSRLLASKSHGGLGYTILDLTHLFSMLVPFGGLSDIGIKPGDTVLIAPATGRHGSAAVHLALALGAHVVAIGRNHGILSKLAAMNPRISSATITGDTARDTDTIRSACGGLADAFWDMSPATAASSTHFKSCLEALRIGARVSLSGGAPLDVNFSYVDILFRALTVKGTMMSTPEQTRRLIKLVESGILPLGDRAGMGPVRAFALEAWEEAWDAADQRREPGEIVITPQAPK